MVRLAPVAFAAAASLALCACDRPAEPSLQAGVATAVPTGTIDSILPSEEALRRFQSRLPRVTALRSAAQSRDGLVTRLFHALETGDTAAARGLLVSEAEYAYLYFPTSVYTRKPYELPPEVAWMLSDQNNRKGFTRLTRRLSGKRLDFRGYQCGGSVTESANRFWRSCDVSYTDPVSRRMVTRRLFGSIMERNGKYKFLSYANDF